MEQLAFRAMDCDMLAALAQDGPAAQARLARVPTWFAVWERRLSRFQPGSELSRLNARAGTTVPASSTLRDVVRVALDAARASDGLVTPTLLDQLELAGYDRSFSALTDVELTGDLPGGMPRVPDPGGWRRIELDDGNGTMCLPAGIRIDLGGGAKGWAADRAARLLSRHGPALVDAGGDIAASAPPPGEPGWPVAVADPRVPDGSLDLVCLERGGLATSGRDRRRWQRGGRWLHHLIDPLTGLPAATDVLTATVVAASAATAEMATKTVLLLGAARGIAWLERRGLGGIVVRESGELVTSREWDRYLW